jgi:hypothetical protein
MITKNQKDKITEVAAMIDEKNFDQLIEILRHEATKAAYVLQRLDQGDRRSLRQMEAEFEKIMAQEKNKKEQNSTV